MAHLPTTMRALTLSAFDGPRALSLQEHSMPQPDKGQVLVKIAAAPINPSDLMFLEGKYGIKRDLPTIPGFEGSGVVVAAGQGVYPRALVGRRVACAAAESGGTWADYIVTSALTCVPLGPHINIAQGSMLLVNPLTAWALLQIARRDKAQAVVQTAAASALGQMVERLGQRLGMPVINIVRRHEQIDLLRAIGAQHILNSNDPNFDQDLRSLCRELRATVAFDAVSGEMTGRVLQAMPRGTHMIVYGALSLEAVQAHPGNFIFRGQRLSGFWLSTWLGQQNPASLLRAATQVQRLFGTAFKPDVRACVPLQEAERALSLYANDMTGGKVLFVPDLGR
jgi:NADPH:quinone reductase-like Zn-dependent oxidoreductase